MWGLNTGTRLQERHEENLSPLTSIGDYSSIPKQSISQVDYNNNNGHTVHIAVVVYISFLRRSFLQSHHPTHALKNTGDHFPRMPYSTHSTSTISYLPLRYEYPTHKKSASRQAPRDAQELIPGHTTGNEVRRACFFQYARIWTQSPDRALNLDFRSSHVWYVTVILTYLFQDLDQDSTSGSVFPSVQSVRLLPRTGRTPNLRPVDETDAKLQSVLTPARDGRPGPTGVSVELLFFNFRAGSLCLKKQNIFIATLSSYLGIRYQIFSSIN